MEFKVVLPEENLLLRELPEDVVVARDPLWDSLRGGDYSAFETVFKKHYTFLFNYGLKLNRDEEEVKDCIQTLFLTIWERRAFLGASDSIRNYLLASLRRLILKRMKMAFSHVELDDDNSEFFIELSAESHMIYDQTLAENVAMVQAAVSCLPDRQKEALYLKFYSEQSFGDIAKIMNISTRAVYKLIYKALDSLNAELSPRLGAKPSFSSLLITLMSSGLPLLETIFFA
ncbi:RNA polymerase sigma factor [Dyadobacter sp. CY312]|uniref:RNA polymerase sigma factor n=1 Tax=Dyadobacter sp. CY312 TaxID=2907303 RepID=UPI001F1D3C5C|nr:sigma-70 family RNA polymerase sigma factor [Dyadobacter sp. CY312]MCE7043210.1 sigma-70 family RNA polymerase sigma factor [Dyadobacter sp. CY312]